MRFLSNVFKEMKKVTWPTGKEVNKYTITVIITVVVALGFFAVVDYGIHQLITFLLK
ncbi:preprotein translocase subunit SecE [Granulicatella adiacens ATCC 49175]|jgi:preprotein translocase, secE subunit|uniref:Protein translocase subunit SecE n=1 Tax=Granulicatella adiacens ATCC 49175 TaxID=638301 RepID=C8NI39_9LACT|nr:preprotein translocase subunit SecE [Granulicatella adiacens]EEW36672.1 preprotein translocase, SecE subunit [Granulicatella adiacens ATCC 49175]MDO4872872.1 preprotein translocase subunit SecE [Carnobacterium sp.]UAK93168.1 preprotein translocase subunit SecE [Granulicatella adiacens]UWP37838.1 preprotein translocase subunit SecE [Granulicatella adiacens ATCC 49175]